MSDPVDFSITSVAMIPGPARVIRMEARDGPTGLLRIEMSPEQFLEALMMDGKTVTAALTQVRKKQ